MEEVPERHYKIPVYKEDVTLEWFGKALLSKYRVKSFQWKGEANSGEGVIRPFERMNIEFESGETVDVVLKILPPQGSAYRNFKVFCGFAQREIQMYTELFPAWDEFLHSKNVPPNFRYRHPTCYLAGCNFTFGKVPRNLEPYQQIIIMEDLKATGFEMLPEGHSLSWRKPNPAFASSRYFMPFHWPTRK